MLILRTYPWIPWPVSLVLKWRCTHPKAAIKRIGNVLMRIAAPVHSNISVLQNDRLCTMLLNLAHHLFVLSLILFIILFIIILILSINFLHCILLKNKCISNN